MRHLRVPDGPVSSPDRPTSALPGPHGYTDKTADRPRHSSSLRRYFPVVGLLIRPRLQNPRPGCAVSDTRLRVSPPQPTLPAQPRPADKHLPFGIRHAEWPMAPADFHFARNFVY